MSSIIIHGGIKEFENTGSSERDCQTALARIVNHAYQVLQQDGARAAVLDAVVALEDCELFNAGTGSRIQADGEIRMSASLMDGKQNIFSGVINIQYVKNPVLVAARLAGDSSLVLAGHEATLYARDNGFASHDPYTEHRLREHRAGMRGLTGTVGACAVDSEGAIFAATSTGGVGGETPGRVSDTATVAGNYASPNVGVSCTGNGEEIVNLCVAARIATRRMVGLSLQQAVQATIEEGCRHGYYFGVIGVDESGEMIVSETRGKTMFATADEKGSRIFE